MIADRLNAILDELPRTRVGRLSREGPAFRACGVVGYYLALIVLLGGGLLAGQSLLVLAGLALTCAISFYVYTYLRMWVTGHEQLVLLEHVWFALGSCGLVLWWMGEPILGYLDVVAVALCPFLAMGRVGCTLVGCCHGKPSSIGIVYGEAAVLDGFPRYLAGVRLFPVPAIEAVGLACIGLTGFIALPFARPGDVFAWYLLAYAVMRFGLEGLRGDRRPHLLGLSQARWMASLEVLGAILLGSHTGSGAMLSVLVVLTVALVPALVRSRKHDLGASLLASTHVRELREVVAAQLPLGMDPMCAPQRRLATSLGIGVTASFVRLEGHVALRLPGNKRDLALLCDLAIAAFPEIRSHSGRYEVDEGVLQVSVPLPLTILPSDTRHVFGGGGILYGPLVRQLQQPAQPRSPHVVPDTDSHGEPHHVPPRQNGHARMTDGLPAYFLTPADLMRGDPHPSRSG